MTVNLHAKVQHNTYGKGEVVKVTDDNVYVLFGNQKRIFPYPEAFEKAYLIAIDADTMTVEMPHNDNYGELKMEDIKHRIVVIKVNQLYKENMSSEDLYNNVRGIWRASKERAQNVDYAFGVYKSQIVAVYKPSKWFVCKEAKDRLPREDIVLGPRNENRIFFVDESYEQGLPLDENQKYYLGKSIDKLTVNKNSQNPISYLEPMS